eukprot:m51a1_g12195 hypothetical protein (944) ;mRNA; r:32401-36094
MSAAASSSSSPSADATCVTSVPLSSTQGNGAASASASAASLGVRRAASITGAASVRGAGRLRMLTQQRVMRTQSTATASSGVSLGSSVSGGSGASGSAAAGAAPTGLRLKDLGMKKINRKAQPGAKLADVVGQVRMSQMALAPQLPTPRSALHYIRDNIGANPTPEEAERVRRETVDPFMRNRPKRHVPKKLLLALPVVIVVTVALMLVCLGIDRATQSWTYRGVVPLYYDYTVEAFVFTMLNPSYDQCQNSINGYTNMLTFILSLVITIMGIVLNFASDNLTSNITTFFFKDTVVVGGLLGCVIANCYSLWVYDEIGGAHIPHISIFMVLFITTSLLVLLFPFLAYMMQFLDPEEVVTKIVTHGLNSVVESVNSDKGVETNKARSGAHTVLTIEFLMEGAVSALKRKSRNVTSEIVDALCSFCMHYVSIKDRAPESWFQIPTWIRQSPDFVILNDESLQLLSQRRLWVEWKVLRQYQNLFTEAIANLKEMCYHICVNTRIIGETAASYNQIQLLDLCTKFFNTYLRMSVNLVDFRVVYNTFYQYRQLAELLIDSDRTTSREMAIRALKIAKFIRYYAYICQTKKLFFLVETAAQDLRVICEVALRSSLPKKSERKKAGWSPVRSMFRDIHAQLLAVLLSFDDFIDAGSRRGVMRAQVMLALWYVAENQMGHARAVMRQLAREENKALLISIHAEIDGPSTREFWEVSERGYNFTYVEPRLREQLQTFFAWFPWFKVDDTDGMRKAFFESKEGKALRVQQDLENFEAVLSDDEEAAEDDDGLDNSVAEDLEAATDELPIPSAHAPRAQTFGYRAPAQAPPLVEEPQVTVTAPAQASGTTPRQRSVGADLIEASAMLYATVSKMALVPPKPDALAELDNLTLGSSKTPQPHALPPPAVDGAELREQALAADTAPASEQQTVAAPRDDVAEAKQEDSSGSLRMHR